MIFLKINIVIVKLVGFIFIMYIFFYINNIKLNLIIYFFIILIFNLLSYN